MSEIHIFLAKSGARTCYHALNAERITKAYIRLDIRKILIWIIIYLNILHKKKK